MTPAPMAYEVVVALVCVGAPLDDLLRVHHTMSYMRRTREREEAVHQGILNVLLLHIPEALKTLNSGDLGD